jgi:hypothetical protein
MTKKLLQMKLLTPILLLAASLFSGCATIYENGKPVMQLSADATNVTFETPRGTRFHADTFAPSKFVGMASSLIGVSAAGALPIVRSIIK